MQNYRSMLTNLRLDTAGRRLGEAVPGQAVQIWSLVAVFSIGVVAIFGLWCSWRCVKKLHAGVASLGWCALECSRGLAAKTADAAARKCAGFNWSGRAVNATQSSLMDTGHITGLNSQEEGVFPTELVVIQPLCSYGAVPETGSEEDDLGAWTYENNRHLADLSQTGFYEALTGGSLSLGSKPTRSAQLGF